MKPGTAEAIGIYGCKLAAALETDPSLLAPLKLHYLRWVLFDDDTRFMYQGIFDTDFDKYTKRCRARTSGAAIQGILRSPVSCACTE